MKIHFDPLWNRKKKRKKPDLEETLGPLWNWKVVRDETGKGRMVMRLRLSKDAVAREAKAGYKAGNESVDKINEESKEYTEEKKYGEEKSLSEEEYNQKIREAYLEARFEGMEYLRKGDKEKAVEKFDTALKLYNSLQAFKSILQQEGGKKGLEEKLTEEKIEEEKAEEEIPKENIAKKFKGRFSKKPAITLYIDKGFFLNKWAGCFIPGAKIARENWRIQGRPGWRSKKWPFKDKVWFGQPGWYDEKPIDARFTHYVYEKNYMEAKEGEKAEKKLVYKISDKMLEKVPKEIMKRGSEEEILDAQIRLNCGGSYYGELWKKDPRLGHKGWDIWSQICEDFYKEHKESTKNIKDSYMNGKNGLICLDTTLGGSGKYTLVEQPKHGAYGLLKWGRLYNLLTHRGKLGMGENYTDTYFLNKHVVPSIFLGKRFALYDKFKLSGKRKLATINKQRIKTWLHLGRPHYKVHIYDKELAKDENFKQILTLIVPYLEKERQYHKLRCKFEDKPGPYSILALQKYADYLVQQNIWGR